MYAFCCSYTIVSLTIPHVPQEKDSRDAESAWAALTAVSTGSRCTAEAAGSKDISIAAALSRVKGSTAMEDVEGGKRRCEEEDDEHEEDDDDDGLGHTREEFFAAFLSERYEQRISVLVDDDLVDVDEKFLDPITGCKTSTPCCKPKCGYCAAGRVDRFWG